MIKQVFFLTCASVFVMSPTPAKSAARAQSWGNNVESSSDFEYIAEAKRYHRNTKEEDSSDLTESVDDYPVDTIRELISENPSLGIFFQKKKIPNFGHRHNSFDQSEDTSMCNSIFNTKWPQKLKNRKGILKYVVNLDSSYQPVYVETCKKNAVCTLKEFFPLEYKSECKQKYAIVRLVSLDNPSDRTFAVDEFDIPCGCVCTIKKTQG